MLAGGPSFIDVKQTVVIDVKYAEEFPYDTATFTGVDSKRGTGTATGFNAGVDFQWMFNPKLGAGALVRITKATVDLNRRQPDDPGRRGGDTDSGGHPDSLLGSERVKFQLQQYQGIPTPKHQRSRQVSLGVGSRECLGYWAWRLAVDGFQL